MLVELYVTRKLPCVPIYCNFIRQLLMLNNFLVGITKTPLFTMFSKDIFIFIAKLIDESYLWDQTLITYLIEYRQTDSKVNFDRSWNKMNQMAFYLMYKEWYINIKVLVFLSRGNAGTRGNNSSSLIKWCGNTKYIKCRSCST